MLSKTLNNAGQNINTPQLHTMNNVLILPPTWVPSALYPAWPWPPPPQIIHKTKHPFPLLHDEVHPDAHVDAFTLIIGANGIIDVMKNFCSNIARDMY